MPDSISIRNLLPYLAALGIAAFAVNVDLHNDEPQAAALVLVVGGLILGALAPRHAWRWALILGLSIFVGDYLGERLGVGTLYPTPVWNFGALVALVPATIGTYAGVGIRSVMGSGATTRG